jgi:hypothetical protein
MVPVTSIGGNVHWRRRLTLGLTFSRGRAWKGRLALEGSSRNSVARAQVAHFYGHNSKLGGKETNQM